MSQIKPEETVFQRIGQSISIYKDNIAPLFIFPLAFTLINFWLIYLLTMILVDTTTDLTWTDLSSLSPSDFINWSMVISMIAWFIVSILIWIINFLTLTYMLIKIFKWEKVDIMDTLSFAISNIVKYVIAGIQIIIYWFWIPILLTLGWLILNIIIWPLWAIVLMAGIIWIIIEAIRLFPAFYIVLDQEKSWKEAVEVAKQITNWKWWRTFWNFLLTWIIFWIIIWILGGILLMALSIFADILMQAVMTWIMWLFWFLLYKRYQLESNWKEPEEFKKGKEETKENKKSEEK